MKKKTKEMILPEISEELVIEILMRLPVKSLMRFKCVSKLWFSLITSRYLTNFFLKSSSSRQRSFAYIVADEDGKYELFASSARDHSNTSVSVIDQDLTLPGLRGCFVSAVRGLVCFTFENRVRICNINTRQVVELPHLMRLEAIGNITVRYYFGHDPVHDEYKVLSVAKEEIQRSENQVLILGPGASWRKIQCHIPHCSYGKEMTNSYVKEITINGVLYYGAYTSGFRLVIMCFDLSSEEFNVIELPDKDNNIDLSCRTLVNYRGKLAFLDYHGVSEEGNVDVWILENAEKSQWSNKKTFVLPFSQMNIVPGDMVMMCGTSYSGKVWLVNLYFTQNQSAPVRFFIYDLERNKITQRIELGPLRYGTQLTCSLRTKFKSSTFWDDIENIMYLET